MMKRKDIVQFSMSGIAIVISLATAFYAASVSREVSSSDYGASQRVKSETARLLASLRSMVIKGVDAAIFKEDADLSSERQSINEFINSPTAFAYYAWAGLKSDQAGKGVPEKWRLLFRHLSMLSHSDDPQEYVQLAARTERMFDSLEEKDLNVIVRFNSDLIYGIANAKQGRTGAPLLETIHEMIQEDATQEGKYSEVTVRRLVFLKEQKDIDDPDVDLVLATLQQDAQGVRAALERGGNMNLPFEKLFERYKDELAEFQEYDDGP